MSNFQTWWDSEGSAMRPLENEDLEEFAKSVASIAWINGGFCAIEVRKAFDEATALAEQPAQQEPLGYIAIMALNDLQESIYGDVAVYGEDLEDTVAIYTTPQAQPAREPQWINPNDKTQKQYLPGVGVPVLFCHGGNTYYGRHTGGSFQYGAGATSRYFDTWECRWMPLPAAHRITKGGTQ